MSTPRIVFRAVVFSLAGLVLVVLGVGQLLAKEWRVETVRTLKAPAERVGARVGDLGTWASWSAMEMNVGPQTARQVVGPPGAGQRIEWAGPRGTAVLTATAVDATSLDYTVGFRVADAPPLGRGRVAWRAVGGDCEVRWLDQGVYDNVMLRWFGWFGALQEKVKQIQGASLESLEQELEREAGAGSTPTRTK